MMNSEALVNPKVILVITKQVNELLKRPPAGVKYIQNDLDILDIQADIYGQVDTPYYGGVFRIKLVLPPDFPRSPPKGYFLTKIFHPNISEKGEICVNTLKREWDPSNWSLHNILEVIKCLLIIPFPESALNEEAGKLFMENYEEYAKYAKLMTELHAIPRDKAAAIPIPRATPMKTAMIIESSKSADKALSPQKNVGTSEFSLIKENMVENTSSTVVLD
eukprot:TRINITY_DN122_c0_g2_i7.p1 TRINITY_DN122_c0_g2~~TRINITY_DN122_c0_g2_i7.p1  ORF type:complete len:220 (+),score=43.11 TRINITY_DN122_c0_g2_i7:206-865(+)